MLKQQIIQQIIELGEKYPKLSYYRERGNKFEILGDIELIDSDKIDWGSFSIRIEISNEYPSNIPIVFETKKKIPWKYSRHLNLEGECCLSPEVEEHIILGRNYTLIDYLEKLVVPFFVSQRYFELTGNWLNGQYSHNTEGLLEYYKERFQTEEIKIIIVSFKVLFGEINLGRNDKCYCNSGKNFKKCHGLILNDFRKVDKSLLRKNFEKISYFEKSPIKGIYI